MCTCLRVLLASHSRLYAVYAYTIHTEFTYQMLKLHFRGVGLQLVFFKSRLSRLKQLKLTK